MKEASFGIIPLRTVEGIWHTLLVQLHAGHWGFPKGHKNSPDEAPKEAAIRELYEETSLIPTEFLALPPFVENYSVYKEGELRDKSVWYYPAIVQGTLELQTAEIKEARWIPLQQAPELLTYPGSQNIARLLIKCI